MTQVLEIVRVEDKLLLVGRFPLARVKRDILDDIMAYATDLVESSPYVADAIVTCADQSLNEGFIAIKVTDETTAAVPLLIDKFSAELLEMVNLTPCSARLLRPMPNFSI